MVLPLVLFCPRGNLDVLFIEYAHHPRGNFVVNDGPVVYGNDVGAKFLEEGREKAVVCVRCTFHK